MSDQLSSGGKDCSKPKCSSWKFLGGFPSQFPSHVICQETYFDLFSVSLLEQSLSWPHSLCGGGCTEAVLRHFLEQQVMGWLQFPLYSSVCGVCVCVCVCASCSDDRIRAYRSIGPECILYDYTSEVGCVPRSVMWTMKLC